MLLWDDAFFWGEIVTFGLLLVSTLVSAIMVYSNEKEVFTKKLLIYEILGPLDVFFTDEFLNKRGKKWRPIYLASVSLLVLFVGVMV